MIRKDIEKIECTIMPLTDIHIGSGIDLASYEYVIKDGVFYRIDLGEIFYNFPEDMRLKLTELMEEKNMKYQESDTTNSKLLNPYTK